MSITSQQEDTKELRLEAFGIDTTFVSDYR